MSVNKYSPHVLVLPEDDANRQLANGFLLEPSLETRRVQVLEEAGGWRRVLDCFKVEHVAGMERYAQRFMVLLIDFDQQEDRQGAARSEIPDHLRDRVFILGAWREPEDLRPELGSYETIGLALARECRDKTDATWMHGLLRHNANELERLRSQVRPILFPPD